MIFTIVRAVFFIICVITVVMGIREYKKEEKINVKIIKCIIALIICTLVNLYPPENYLFNFSSLEKAHKYSCPCEEYLSADGVNSALVYHQNKFCISEKSYKGYKLPVEDKLLYENAIYYDDNIEFFIYRYPAGSDYYAFIIDNDNKIEAISDNEDSHFQAHKFTDKTVYCAHIKKYSQVDYRIFINEKDVIREIEEKSELV